MYDGSIKSTPEFPIKRDLFNIPPLVPLSLDYNQILNNYNQSIKNKKNINDFVETNVANNENISDSVKNSTLIFYTLNTNYPVCFNIENNDFIIPQILNISMIITPGSIFHEPGFTPFQLLKKSNILTYRLRQTNINFSYVDLMFIRKNKLSKNYNNEFNNYGKIECFFNTIIQRYNGDVTFISLNGFKQDHIILYSYILYYLKSRKPEEVAKLKNIISKIKFMDPITTFVSNFDNFYTDNNNSCNINNNTEINTHIDMSVNEYELLNKLFNKYNMDTQIYNLPFSSSNISQLLMIFAILHHEKFKKKLPYNIIYYDDFVDLCINHQTTFDSVKLLL
ncbi:hypothetical protein TONV_107 [Tipula oleracea nudivirus]|uniref:Uncharacterized protein n=1 Tax=Tipula oleracea nudivirus TaxID=1546257 RepID=A0A0B4VG19_9VIRU|nr:hypothetical protein TONV_107 [Tipula oleracea nudivirus]AJD20167.1 hypothetical protein TONV_107 [Tipula oleracea nudivirus]